jgi:hypothetical protein
MMREWVTQVHIPRTGGTALREAMRGYRWWRMAGHPVTLEKVTTPLAVVTVRDPVARFISVCRWGRDVMRSAGYRDAEELALDIGRLDELDEYQTMLAPQVVWCISAEYVRERCIWWGHTETLDQDFERLKACMDIDDTHQLPTVGEVKRNAGPPDVHFELSPLAEANVRDWYAIDTELVEALA